MKTYTLVGYVPWGTDNDSPELQNCDDWGTGEGQYHGRM